MPAPDGATRFRAVRPTRIVDAGSINGWTRVDAGRLRVPIAGRAGVPSGAVAVAVRITGVSSDGETSVTVVPAAGDIDGADETDGGGRAGAATSFVLLGGGAVDVLHGAATTGLTVDVLGYFESVDAACSDGRFVTVAPTTVTDTRVAARPFACSETRSITLGETVPAGAHAVLVQLTAMTDRTASEWTLHPPDATGYPPTLVTGGGRRTASTVVPLASAGVELTSRDGGHVRIDVIGYVTGNDAPAGVDGLYVPTPPRRLLDTRRLAQPIPDGSCREIAAGPPECSAVALTVTTVALQGDGDLAWWGAGSSPASTAPVALGPPDVPETNQIVVPAGRRGAALATAGGAGHVVVDLHGWFTGSRSTDRVPVCGAQPLGIAGIDMESYADEWLDYGTSTDGRPLRVFRFGSGRRTGLLTTGLHGNEHTGTSVLADLVTRQRLDGWTLWLVPVANPDARAANARFVRDVDMNRDFPADWSAIPNPTPSGCVTTRTGSAPHSLVESRQLATAMTDGPFRRATISISHHDNYNWVAPQTGSPPELRELGGRIRDHDRPAPAGRRRLESADVPEHHPRRRRLRDLRPLARHGVVSRREQGGVLRRRVVRRRVRAAAFARDSRAALRSVARLALRRSTPGD